ncbi:predicted protein [Bacteroides caccae CAG:21]|nr:predicted protein [Bacteroides caccae CAG:21]
MSRKLISAAHSLQLVPVYNIIHFGIVRSKVVIRSIGKPDILMIVPGTLKPGDSKNEDVYTKKHTFKLADVSQNKTLYLENLKATPFVALYTDETGNTRVSGSPDYPLTFSFEIGGGLYNYTLSGTGAPCPVRVWALMRSCRFLSVLLYL